MTTAGDIITRSHRLIGALGKGRTLSAAELADGLEVFIAMLASMSLDSHSLAYFKTISTTLSGTGKTIGASGADWTEERPEWIESAYTNATGIDKPLRIIGQKEYDGISLKNTIGPPTVLYYERSYPLGTLYFYPAIDSGVTVTLRAAMQLSSAAALTSATDLTISPADEEGLAYALAFRLAPEFDRTLDALTISIGMQAISRLKVKNAAAQNEPVGLFGSMRQRSRTIQEG
jgi:hypothetical protein